MLSRRRRAPVFISFDRSDAGGYSFTLWEHLERRVGERLVFRDAQKIEPGDQWQKTLRQALDDAKVMLLVVGRDWQQPELLARLNDDTDPSWVRLEVVRAHQRGIPIIPCLMDGATLPAAERLPEDMRAAIGAATRQHIALNLRGSTTWRAEFDELAAVVCGHAGLAPARRLAPMQTSAYERVLCRLGRAKPASHVVVRRRESARLFHLVGGEREGARYFALRCAMEDLAPADADAGQALLLDWNAFSEAEDVTLRREWLVRDALAQLGLAASAVGAAGEQQLCDWLHANDRPTVLYTLAPSCNRERASEWLELWSGWLHSADPAATSVMLCLAPGISAVWNFGRLGDDTCGIRPYLGRVRRQSLRAWLNRHAGGTLADADDLRVLHRAAQGLYGGWLMRLIRRRLHFSDIGDGLYEHWKQLTPQGDSVDSGNPG